LTAFKASEFCERFWWKYQLLISNQFYHGILLCLISNTVS
jgi:hypothetical protein